MTQRAQAVPAALGRPSAGLGAGVADWAAVLRDLLDAAADADGTRPGPARAKLFERLTATMACKAAVKLGERLRPGEVATLLERRASADRSHLCPHGRPTALAFPASEIERQFKR